MLGITAGGSPGGGGTFIDTKQDLDFGNLFDDEFTGTGGIDTFIFTRHEPEPGQNGVSDTDLITGFTPGSDIIDLSGYAGVAGLDFAISAGNWRQAFGTVNGEFALILTFDVDEETADPENGVLPGFYQEAVILRGLTAADFDPFEDAVSAGLLF